MYRIITPAVGTPVSLAEVKSHLRLESDDINEDAVLSLLKTAAIESVERYLRRTLMVQTVEEYFDEFDNIMCLQLLPLLSVTKIEYLDENDILQTVSASDYYVDTYSSPGRIILNPDKEWPTLDGIQPTHKIVVTYTCGYSTSDDVPSAIKVGILMEISNLFEVRSSEVMISQSPFHRISKTSELMLNPYRMFAF